MAKLKQGDRTAFDYVYKNSWPPCLSLAKSFLSKEEDAQDAAQAAFLKVFSRASQFDPEKDALTWVFALVVYECKTLHRKKQRLRESHTDLESIDDHDGEMELKLIEKKMRLQARELIKDLKPMDQEVILKVINEEESQKGALFRKRLERAIKRFKQAWEKRYG